MRQIKVFEEVVLKGKNKKIRIINPDSKEYSKIRKRRECYE